MINGRVIGWVEDSESDGYPVWSSWDAYQRAIYFLNRDGIVDTTFNFTPYNENDENYNFLYNLIMELRDDMGTTLEVDYSTDWNIVGLPVLVDDNFYQSIFPNSVSGTLFSFNGTYVQEETLNNGAGYWLRFENSTSNSFNGNPIVELELTLNEDWNLISAISTAFDISDIQDPDGIIITGTVYGFALGGYSNAEILEPGKGYWVRANNTGDILFVGEPELLPEECYLEPDVGPCDGICPRYFYNQESEGCEEFSWGCCEGLVPFDSLEECINACE